MLFLIISFQSLFHDIISSFSFSLFSNFPLLKNLIAVSCVSGDDIKIPLNQLRCSFAELVFHIVLSDSSVVVVSDGTASMQNNSNELFITSLFE